MQPRPNAFTAISDEEPERQAARQLRRLIAAQPDGARLTVYDEAGKAPAEVRLGADLTQKLLELLRHVGDGQTVSIVPVDDFLTTQQAADLLNMSRPSLVKLLETGRIPYSRAAQHRRIRADDLLRYKAERDAVRRAALAALAKIDAPHL